MCGALILGLFCGVVARLLIPGDAFRRMSGPRSWLVSIGLGLLGALVGYLIFTLGLGIGDDDIFDWGGVLSALIGTVIVLVVATVILRAMARNRPGPPPGSRADPAEAQRSTRAPAPRTSASTSARLAMDVSPGVVIASAPWAAPYSTARARSPSSSSSP